ncbi:unnamed protein product [Commensalibacter communis]|uniref:hypothetical protein n=1 Tax=Commensalibacter communis TaxID=2972786 RepID=UPI0022FF9B5A|nr:hypothetical protein [Commensalibacter communis]CAI3958053.1 unnamed protein product [Commensalibacter communis]
MKILKDDSITLQPVRLTFYKGRICINGRRTWYKVDGRTLEQAIQIKDYYLLFVSIKYSEDNWISDCSIYLINKSGRILEERNICATQKDDPMGYAADYMAQYDYENEYCGYLDQFTLIPPHTVTFRFRDYTYSIEVLDKPVYPWLNYFSKKDHQPNRRNDGYGFGKNALITLRSRLHISIIKELNSICDT